MTGWKELIQPFFGHPLIYFDKRFYSLFLLFSVKSKCGNNFIKMRFYIIKN